MADAGPKWRPPASIRLKTVAIARHEDRLLVGEVLDDDGKVTGWCPLGGGVQFGEAAADGLKRELREELACEAAITGPPLLCENIYEHYSETGHEIVVAFPVRFPDAWVYATHRFQIREDSGALHWVEWVDLARFRSGKETLYPLALAPQILAMDVP